ncbi:MAG: tRNA 2-thiouridine(34) synthase MnmA [Planctomycetota bacterium]
MARDTRESGRSAGSVLVAMSGGVDSSVAAFLLKEAGRDVTGVFLRTGAHSEGNTKSCCSLEDGRDARAVADLLGIPFYALNFEAEFAAIIDDFVDEYSRARTPNPCILCNRDLKFGKLYEHATAVGATLVATGHYATVLDQDIDGDVRRAVRRGRDPGKDQSYVLFPLTQEQLARTHLPLGDMQKDEVREVARRAGLPVAAKAESQEICFVPPAGYRALLDARGIGTPGEIAGEDGTVVGRHDGFERMTIGQRKGIGAHGAPRYVTGIDAATARVTIGPREALLKKSLVARGWVGGGRPAPAEGESFEALVQIRYRHQASSARVEGMGDGAVRIVFGEAQSALTPGQAVVAYDGDVVAGGGWINTVGDG